MTLLEGIEKLKKSPLPEVREELATQISGYFNDSVFDKFENKLACEIIRLLAHDVEVRVRKALSESLKENPSIPHDVAVRLAEDVLDVATPILTYSKVLTDEDLVSIIQSTKEIQRLKLISQRDQLSETVSGALIDTKKDEVVVSLLENKTASISEGSLQEVVNEFREHGQVVEKLVFRGDLPVAVVERVISFASDELKATLLEKYKIDPAQVQEVTDVAREKATLGILDVSQESAPTEHVTPTQLAGSIKGDDVPELDRLFDPIVFKKTKELVDHLRQTDKLTYSIMLRALCEGNLSFFEIGMARLAGAPILNAHTLIWAANSSAFESLYKRAKMPMSTFAAVEVVLKFVKEEYQHGGAGTSGFRQRMVERLLNSGYDRSIPLMPYLITLINSRLTTKDILH